MGFYQFLNNRLSRYFPTDAVVQRRYTAFMKLLEHDREAHEKMAEIEELYYNQVAVDFKVLQEKYNTLSKTVQKIITSLSTIRSKTSPDLERFYRLIDGFGRHLFYEKTPETAPPFAMELESDKATDKNLSGGKAAVLSLITSTSDLVVPKGFVITTRAFNLFIEQNHLREQIDTLLARLDVSSPESLGSTSTKIIAMLQQADIPPEIKSRIAGMAGQFRPADRQGVRFAVRSSAVGEDDTLSFAGQYRSLINVRLEHIVDAWRRVIESKYSTRALSYRIQCGFTDAQTPMGVLVLEMIDPDTSGVMYTKGPGKTQDDDIYIHSVIGLGELLVDGRVTPEITRIKKQKPLRITGRQNAVQKLKAMPSNDGGTAIVEVDKKSNGQKVLEGKYALCLAETGIVLEHLFKAPQDVEWCIQDDGTIVVLQSRPLQTHAEQDREALECIFDDLRDHSIASGGQTAAAGIAAGLAKHIKEKSDLDSFPSGGVLIAPCALPDFAQIIGRVAAVVTEAGSSAGHLASVAREFGIPFITGLENAMAKIPDSTMVTVNSIEKKIYRGRVKALLKNPCAKPRPLSESPFMRRFAFLMRFVSPLELVDPEAGNFTPTGCRSFHDIIRYCHETAVNSMFQIGRHRWFTTRGIKKLDAQIPIKMNVLDVGSGLCDSASDKKNITREQIKSLPMKAVLKGLLHPGIQWGSFSHFNWEEHDRLVMQGGIISPDNAMFASHAILAREYANLSLKFGYHFVIVDALLSDTLPENQIRFRFSGGGAGMEKRLLRTRFLGRILTWLDFTVTTTHDLVDAVFMSGDTAKSMEKLEMTGRLLGATRLMDMYLKTDDHVEQSVRDFKNGIYHYSDEPE